MKALVVKGKKELEIAELPRPVPKDGEILIKISHCLICTWEMRIYSGESSMQLPFVPGHEAAGIVEEVPETTSSSFKKGDRVVFKTLDHCGHCSYCYSGNDNQCTGTAKKRFYGDIPGSGGLAQYITLEPARVFPFHGDKPLETAAFTEPLACCIHSVQRGRIELGETVVIIGAGIMGQLHLLLSQLRGARTLVIEPRQERRDMAMELGAFATIDPTAVDSREKVFSFTEGEGADAVFLTAPDPSLAELAIGLARKTGRVVFYGSFHPNRPIAADPNGIHYSEVVITGSSGPATGDFLKASRLIAYGMVPVEKLLTRLYPMDQASEAFEAALSPDSYRVGIELE